MPTALPPHARRVTRSFSMADGDWTPLRERARALGVSASRALEMAVDLFVTLPDLARGEHQVRPVRGGLEFRIVVPDDAQGRAQLARIITEYTTK